MTVEEEIGTVFRPLLFRLKADKRTVPNSYWANKQISKTADPGDGFSRLRLVERIAEPSPRSKEQPIEKDPELPRCQRGKDAKRIKDRKAAKRSKQLTVI